MTSKSSNGSGTKRQRTSPHTPITVNDLLSADLWCGIADFLPKTSRILLAVALTAPPASFRESAWLERTAERCQQGNHFIGRRQGII
ncbi:hypothetical protein QTG54_013523 [Skeletonema marinoi]|uniref:Uncharacterized protein n=1 Tax=Skeletonema marinoi TaxID=267567 RepID=A0AAD8XYH9_9STRA|nr:hypothetical protein QTG54_013523 [Skeletonema marinoi]